MKQKRIRAGPELSEGFNLVEGDARFEPLLRGVGGAVWIDAGSHVSTHRLASVDEELLDCVSIGRAFTAFQHFTLVSRLEQFVEPETEILVLPSIDLLYAEGQPRDQEAEELFREMLSRLEKVSRSEDLKVVISTETDLGFLAEGLAETRIEIGENAEGTRYRSPGFETLAYPVGPGTLQSTVPLFTGGEDAGGEPWEGPTRPTATASTT